SRVCLGASGGFVCVLFVFFLSVWVVRARRGPRPPGPGVAYLAHVVGFSVGFCYAWVRYRRTTRVRRPVTAVEGDSQP
ncbi:rhomboid family intramembrane serine protease, partial [Streptomyces sp. NPDC059708]|uniref:rhomboid family intramembrane serine protease n=1 Tax=Streptomyces sp. NPDC059708 TaxID=3346916 RepID=UPI0036BEAD41